MTKNPAKLERCIKKVRAKSKKVNPYAVCKAAMKKPKKNPTGFVLYARRAGGPLLYFDGLGKFTNNGKPYIFGTLNRARDKGLEIHRKHSRLLTGYKIWVDSMRKSNPSKRGSTERLDKAAKLLTDFSGHEPETVVKAKVSDKKEGLIFGELDFVGYTTVRDGKTEKYQHKFRKKSRPLLAATSDGKQLHIVGGQYEFTEAGIEDR